MQRVFFLILTASLFSLAACKSTSEPPSPPPQLPIQILFGPEKLLTTVSVASSGGTVTVSSGADTLRGTTIDVASGTYSSSRTFSLSYAPVQTFKADDDYHPIAPGLIIDNGGGYGEQAMIVTVPVNVPPGEFAMAFAYNDADGSFEGLPILNQTSTSVTFWSLHFDYSDLHESVAYRGNGRITPMGTHRSLITLIAMKKDKIMAMNVSTDFAPGVDDWPFHNYGSAIAPGGHCAGQSMGMIYYFSDHKRKGESKLYTRFDNDNNFATPAVEFDDNAAYRYCSVLQVTHPLYNTSRARIQAALLQLGNNKDFEDSLVFMAFKLAMRITRNPQLVGIYTDTTGHMVIIYGANSNALLVCDPNYPGVTGRTIQFDDLIGFEAYRSGPDAAHLGVAYPIIDYLGTTAAFDWTVTKAQYPKLLNYTVGLAQFPTFTIKVQDSASGIPEVMYTDRRCRAGQVHFTITGSRPLQVWGVCHPDGTWITPLTGWWYPIPDGENQLGIYLVDTGNHWAGFKWYEFGGKEGHFPSRCSRDLVWETLLSQSNVVSTDSGSYGRRVILEDLGEPMNICTEVHPQIHWAADGDISGLTISGYAYWGLLWGHDVPMSPSENGYAGDDEIGLKQAYDEKPGWIGLQLRITFPSQGDLSTDLAYLFNKQFAATIKMTYKEDPGTN